MFNENKRILKKLKKVVDRSMAFDFRSFSDEQLRDRTNIFRNRLKNGATLEELMPEAFAVVCEAADRVRHERPYPVQILGACVMAQGDLAEMKTGEGKTLTATLCAYLRALEGKGVHVVTVNEYLSGRDGEEMGDIYRFLGLSVGINKQSLTPQEKRAAYACDITYSTNSELGFDYLRDNMATSIEDRVMRSLHFALIDEADSILIDEARTPLIISGQGKETSQEFIIVDRAVKHLKESNLERFTKEQQVALSPSGIRKLEKAFGIQNLFAPEQQHLLHRVNKALYANYILKKDVHYIVKDDQILLVDAFTGRVMPGRAYSDGLQQAIQAKENVKIEAENKTIATITYQNFFRLYDALAGMTGTAKTEEEEFLSIYNMRVVVVPTNKPIIRDDQIDAIYKTKKQKYEAIVEEVKKAYQIRRPVLIGTEDIAVNEELSALLNKEHIPHEVLNAKNHEREAEIIAKAGEAGAVTLATNMAGRGTDIKLSEETRALGGLLVIGTQRHESRRIDNQLRGRSGRQGDPGTSKFFVSLEDELLKRYGGPSVEKLFDKLDDGKLESKMLSRSITNAQKNVEGYNFDIRKQLIEFDDVLRTQREIFYRQRDEILTADGPATHQKIHEIFDRCMRTLYERFMDDPASLKKWIDTSLKPVDVQDRTYRTKIELFQLDELQQAKDPIAFLQDRLWGYYESLIHLTDEIYRYAFGLEHSIVLKVMDDAWMDHIDYMDKLKSGMSLRSYAQKKPIEEYQEEGFTAFQNLMNTIAERTTGILCSLRPFDDRKKYEEKIAESEKEGN